MVTLTLIDPQTRQPQKQWSFPTQTSIRIGRMSDNDVVLSQFLEVSRHHLELRQIDHEPPQWQLISQGTNGTFIDGVLVGQTIITADALLQLAKDGPILQLQLGLEAESEIPPQTAHSHWGDRPSNNLNASLPPKVHCAHQGNPPNNLFCIHCGQPIVSEERFVRQYQILKTLGKGGMGTTYLSYDRTKSLRAPFLLVLKEMNADMAAVAKARELFEREARILKSLQHSGIPKYYDFFVEGGRKYLAMELIHGQNLEQLVYQRGPADPTTVVKWMIEVCKILAYLHSLQPPLIHRDVKPANLMLRTRDQLPVLLDFGAVKEIGTPLATRIGAEGYSAPEQNRGKPTPQSDIYAIGPTIIFLLTGNSPIKYIRHRRGRFIFDVSSVPTITPQLQEIITQCSEPNLRDRFASANQVAQALTFCLNQL